MTISVTVISFSTINYQWFFNGNAISGATNYSLTLTNVSAQNTGNYYVGYTNAGGGLDSSPAAVLVVDTPPTAVGNAYTGRQNTALTVAPSGVLSNDTVATVGPLTAMLVSNVSHGTLTLSTNGGFTYLPATNYYGHDSFTYVASDGMSNSTPATVNLTILAPPSITTQPQNQQVVTNQTASFSVAVGGTVPFTYQWFFGSTRLSGATNATLTISNVTSRSAGQYSVSVSNLLGSISSSAAQLTIISLPVLSTLNVSSVTTNSVVFNASINPNGAATSYYFQYGLTTNYGAFTATNTQSANDDDNAAVWTTGLTPGTTYHYSLVAANPAGAVIGPDATFATAFLPPKAVILDATNVTAGTATLRARVNPHGTTAYYYFVFKPGSGAALITVTNSLNAATNGVDVSVPVTGLSAGTSYSYSLVAVSSGGAVTTDNDMFDTVIIPPVQLNGSAISPGSQNQGGIKLSATSVSGASFTVLGSTNLFLPVTNWVVVGTMTETTPGQYEFSGSTAAKDFSFFRIKSN